MKHIVVMGHGGCGGCAAALAGPAGLGECKEFVGPWVSMLEPAVEEVRAKLVAVPLCRGRVA